MKLETSLYDGKENKSVSSVLVVTCEEDDNWRRIKVISIYLGQMVVIEMTTSSSQSMEIDYKEGQ